MIHFWMKETFVIFLLLSYAIAYRVINCDDNNTELENGEFIKLQTPNYPEIYIPDENVKGYTSCINYFTRIDEQKKIWLVLLSGRIPGLRIKELVEDGSEFQTTETIGDSTPSWFSHLSSSTKLLFAQPFTGIQRYDEGGGWSAFQAFIYAPDLSEICPLNGKTFELLNETEIIPISTSFHNPNYDPQRSIVDANCTWSFKIPIGYKLKINIKLSSYVNSQWLDLKIDDHNRSAINYMPGIQYFDGTYFTFFYTARGPSSLSPTFEYTEPQEISETIKNKYGFAGFVTAVKKDPKIINNCVATNGTITNFNASSGYSDNSVCQKTINIHKNQTMLLSYVGFLEDGADTLIAKDAQNNQFDLTQSNNWFIDGKSENVTIEFKSDGSVVEAGFIITTNNNLSCKCVSEPYLLDCPSKIPGKDGFGLVEGFGYCSNMKCKRKIINNGTCTTLLLIPTLQLREFSNDTVKIKWNNQKVIQLLNQNQDIDNYLIDADESLDEITIEFQSDSTLFGIHQVPSFGFTIISLKNFTTEVIHLSETNFTFTIDISTINYISKLITVLAPENLTLDLFLGENIYFKGPNIYMFSDSFLYDSNSTTNFVGTLDKLPYHPRYRNNLRYYTSKNGSLTLFLYTNMLSNAQATIFFRLREVHAKNCPTMDNVFSIYDTPISISSSTNGSCYFTILNTNLFFNTQVKYISFYTNSQKNITFFDLRYPKIILLEFNSETSSSWKHQLFYGVSNSFLFPPNATMNFTAVQVDGIYTIGLKYQNVQKGILTSSAISDPLWETSGRTDCEILVPFEASCKLTVKFLDVSSNSSLYVTSENMNKSTNITHVNQIITLNNTNITGDYRIRLSYQKPYRDKHGYLIEFEVINSCKKMQSFSLCFVILLFYFLRIF